MTMLGRRHSEETLKRMRASAKGKPKSAQHRANLSKALKGRSLAIDAPQRKTGPRHSEETRAKLRSFRHTEETRAQISSSLRSSKAFQQAIHSPERSKKISTALTDHEVTKETRAKLSEKCRPAAVQNFRGGKIADDFAIILCPAGFVREHHVLWGKGNERFVLDFAHPSGKVNIELDGRSHDATQELDTVRDVLLKSMGWRIIRIKL